MMKRKGVGRRAPTALDSNLTLRARDDLTLQSSNEQASPDASRKRSVSMKLAVGVVLFAALLLRVGWVAHTHAAHLSVDAGDYDRLAHSIAGGHGYLPSAVGIGPSAYRPPAYPYFLAAIYKATGRGWLVARYIEAALSTLTVVLIGLLAWQLWDRRTALIALALAAADLLRWSLSRDRSRNLRSCPAVERSGQSGGTNCAAGQRHDRRCHLDGGVRAGLGPARIRRLPD